MFFFFLIRSKNWRFPSTPIQISFAVVTSNVDSQTSSLLKPKNVRVSRCALIAMFFVLLCHISSGTFYTS